jgi:hypothetical protein
MLKHRWGSFEHLRHFPRETHAEEMVANESREGGIRPTQGEYCPTRDALFKEYRLSAALERKAAQHLAATR